MQREGTSLTLQGEPFRFAGTNLSGSAWTRTWAGSTTPPTSVFGDALKTARVMGERRLPALPVTPPLITSITKRSGINEIAWRGTVGAHTYRGQRSVRGAHGPWTTLTTTPVGDIDTPWLDATTPRTQASYRVSALDQAGRILATSAPLGAGPSQDVEAGPSQDVEVDTLQGWARMSAHSDSLQREPDGDGVHGHRLT